MRSATTSSGVAGVEESPSATTALESLQQEEVTTQFFMEPMVTDLVFDDASILILSEAEPVMSDQTSVFLFSPSKATISSSAVDRTVRTKPGAMQSQRRILKTAKREHFSCSQCMAAFLYESNLRIHRVTAHEDCSRKCPECGKVFSRLAGLRSHIQVHAIEEVVSCELCSEQFSSYSLLRAHSIKDHARDVVLKVRTGNGTYLQCAACDERFEGACQYLQHREKHLQAGPANCLTASKKPAKERSEKQPQSEPKKKEKPRKVHSGQYPYCCQLCPSDFKSESTYKKHLLKFHTEAVLKKEETVKSEEIDHKTSPEERHTRAVEILKSITSEQAGSEESITKLIDSTPSEGCAGVTSSKMDSYTLTDYLPDGSKEEYRVLVTTSEDKKVFLCRLCGKRFTKSFDMVRHCRSHRNVRPFTCGQCGKRFAFKRSMVIHIRSIHERKKPYVCEECCKSFYSLFNLKVHMKGHVGLERSWVCVCKQKFRSLKQMRVHVFECHATDREGEQTEDTSASTQAAKISADEDGSGLADPLIKLEDGSLVELIPRRARFGSEIMDPDERKQRRFSCDLCPAAYKKLDHLLVHKRRHEGVRPFPCETCGKSFTVRSSLIAHQRIHEKAAGVRFRCGQCSSTFLRRSDLLRHQVTHSDKKQFVCPYCRKTYKTSYSCRVHIRHVHSKRTQPILKINVEKPQEQFSAASSQLAQESAAIIVENESDVVGNERDTVIQEELPQPQTDVLLLQETGAFHVTALPCASCNLLFLSQDELNAHVETAHPKATEGSSQVYVLKLEDGEEEAEEVVESSEADGLWEECESKDVPESSVQTKYKKKIHQCTHCGKICSRPSDLIRHTRTHTREKPFECHNCSSSFTLEQNLKAHIRAKHDPKRPRQVQCDECKAFFANNSSLQIHMRIHRGVKPFRCEICFKSFRTSGHLLGHVKTHQRTKKKVTRVHVVTGTTEDTSSSDPIYVVVDDSFGSELPPATKPPPPVIKTEKVCRTCKRMFPSSVALELHMKQLNSLEGLPRREPVKVDSGGSGLRQLSGPTASGYGVARLFQAGVGVFSH
ncbi:unnamed protein product [Cyprideis torosa]|uniref:Uncharacterized protein n=1 Tax=Cyprideis torosa TaxID=163714 RepID=A0A7R8W587_9CRUS|nr:unnamed protein product [Cyprideis torosa]CAG0884891.1 unnamed protein product [Cyprideis torosa]